MPRGSEIIILGVLQSVVAALGYAIKRNGIWHHHLPVGWLCPSESLCFLLQVCKKSPGCNPCGHLFLKSGSNSPGLSKEEKENITNEEADLAFWYVLLIVYRQSGISSREKH